MSERATTYLIRALMAGAVLLFLVFLVNAYALAGPPAPPAPRGLTYVLPAQPNSPTYVLPPTGGITAILPAPGGGVTTVLPATGGVDYIYILPTPSVTGGLYDTNR